MKPLKKINFRILTLAFVQSPIKTFSLYLQINRLFAGFCVRDSSGILLCSDSEAKDTTYSPTAFLPARHYIDCAQHYIIEIDI
jgi:hypothetical protein